MEKSLGNRELIAASRKNLPVRGCELNVKVSITVQRALGPCGPSNMLGAQHESLSTRAGQQEFEEFRERIPSRHKPPLAAPFLN
jgi:hypothetical protein